MVLAVVHEKKACLLATPMGLGWLVFASKESATTWWLWLGCTEEEEKQKKTAR